MKDQKEKRPNKKELQKEISRLSKLKERTKNSTSKFKKQLKISLNTAFLAAFGFLIALSWRDLISELVTNLSSHAPLQGQLVSAIIVTLISVIGILITTSFLSEEK